VRTTGGTQEAAGIRIAPPMSQQFWLPFWCSGMF